MADQGPLSGKLLGSRYQLGARVGRGGFADVYLGEHIHLKTRRAIKVLHTHLADADVKLFREEARLVARLEHKHILSVHDFDLEQGMPFLAMDYAPNGSLRQRHSRGERLSPAVISAYVKQIADALHYAHDQKVIHRDIKPENLLLGRSNDILLSDFGIAVLAQSASQQPSQGFAGTATYAAPEQILGKPQQASDQYALAIMVYEWLAGAPPFQGAPMEVCFQHIQAPPPSLVQRVPGLAPEVERVVFTALAKDPNQRFKQVQAFATALEHASRAAFSAPVAGAAPVPPAQPPLAGQPTTPADNPPVGTATTPLANAPTQAGSSSDNPLPPVGSPTPAARSHLPRGTTIVTREYSAGPLVWSPEGQRIASVDQRKRDYSKGGIEVWDAITGKTLKKLAFVHDYSGASPRAWSPDGKYIVGYAQGTWIWEYDSSGFWHGNRKWRLSYNNTNATLWSPDLSKVAAISPRLVEVSSLRSGKIIISELCNNDVVAWSPDSTRIAWGAENEVPIWDTSERWPKGKHLLTYREHRSPIVAVNWSIDGRQITSQSKDGSRYVWDAGNGKTLATSTAPVEQKRPLVSLGEMTGEISPDGTLKAVPTHDGLELQTVARGETVFVYRGHCTDKTAQHWSPEVKSLAWSPDGTRIAFARFDGTTYVWQAV